LDLLRGLCLVVMTIDHLPLMMLHRFTYETLGYFTAMEGFVLISGITCGMVYGGGGTVQTKRILRRCGYVAFTYALLTLIAYMVSAASGIPSRAPTKGILLVYVVYLLALPLVLRQFHAGHGWRLLCASFGMWLLAQWGIVK
jgi:hypothetical protein